MKILLHACCGNCAIVPVKRLREKHHAVTAYFFNPNIHPYQEFQRRLETLQEYARLAHLDLLVESDYGLVDFLASVATIPQTRCDFCYHVRLDRTACKAAEEGYDAFTTSLLYSRYQQHDKIREYGEMLSEEYGIRFHYEDYRTGWKEGIETSKTMQLYRQQYCGCIYSEMDRYAPQRRN